ncbi:hypothetical protein CU097_004404, partial [Rhizopus azygosporus]
MNHEGRSKSVGRAIRAASRRTKRSFSERSKNCSLVSGTGLIGKEESTFDLLMVFIENCKQIAHKRGFSIGSEMHKLQQPVHHLANIIS